MPKRRRPIEEAWEAFAQRVLPDGAGEEQRSDMQRSFYVGANAFFRYLTDQTEDGEDQSQDHTRELMDDIYADLFDFMDRSRIELELENKKRTQTH